MCVYITHVQEPAKDPVILVTSQLRHELSTVAVKVVASPQRYLWVNHATGTYVWHPR